MKEKQTAKHVNSEFWGFYLFRNKEVHDFCDSSLYLENHLIQFRSRIFRSLTFQMGLEVAVGLKFLEMSMDNSCMFALRTN